MADILFQCEQQGTLGVIYTERWYLREEEEEEEEEEEKGADRLAYFTCLDQHVTVHITTCCALVVKKIKFAMEK